MKTYIVKRIIEQLFEVEVETKEQALSEAQDPYSVKIIRTSAKKLQEAGNEF